MWVVASLGMWRHVKGMRGYGDCGSREAECNTGSVRCSGEGFLVLWVGRRLWWWHISAVVWMAA